MYVLDACVLGNTHDVKLTWRSEDNYVELIFLPPLLGFWGLNSGPEAYVVSSFTSSPISLGHYQFNSTLMMKSI